MNAEITYAARTHMGLVRNNNEDSYLVCPELGLWLVADGMGGHEYGEIASNLAQETIKKQVHAGASLRQAIEGADRAIKKHSYDDPAKASMGTTVVCCKIEGIYFQVAWVGDSRAYLWDDGELSQISKDHSYVQTLFDNELITKEEMFNHPQKNIVTQALGGSTDVPLEVSLVEHAWQPYQKILLCSDGLNDMIPDNEIRDIINNHEGNEATLVDALVQEALDRGGLDNVTAIIISLPKRENVWEKIQRQLDN